MICLVGEGCRRDLGTRDLPTMKSSSSSSSSCYWGGFTDGDCLRARLHILVASRSESRIDESVCSLAVFFVSIVRTKIYPSNILYQRRKTSRSSGTVLGANKKERH